MAESEQAAVGLWSRFRDVAMVLRRMQNFNFSAEGAEGRFTDRWLDQLLTDDELLAEVGRELVLRAVRAGADAINFRVLTCLRDEDVVPVSRLAEVTGLPHFTVSERISDLVQVGLAVRVPEQDAAQATSLTHGILGIVGDIEGRLTALIRERLPELMGR